MDKTGAKLSELMCVFPKRVGSTERKLNCPEEAKFEVVEKFKQYLEDGHKFRKIITIDGVRVERF